jgi:apolipoprotein D and lipocalin family protein
MKIESTYLPVKDFKLENYLGTWYEIARFDHSFEQGLTHVTAQYEMKENGMVRVINKGRKNGKEKIATGKAKFNGDIHLGHLKVSFFLFFYADYIIIYLDDNYETAIVTSGADYLWFLSRKPEISQDKKEQLIQLAKNNGFNTEKLIWVDQQ